MIETITKSKILESIQLMGDMTMFGSTKWKSNLVVSKCYRLLASGSSLSVFSLAAHLLLLHTDAHSSREGLLSERVRGNSIHDVIDTGDVTLNHGERMQKRRNKGGEKASMTTDHSTTHRFQP